MNSIDVTAVLACFTENYIGLQADCNDNANPNPISTYYIQDLGFSTQNISDLCDNEAKQKPIDYLRSKVNFSIKSVVGDVLSAVNMETFFSVHNASQLNCGGDFGQRWLVPPRVQREFGVQIKGCKGFNIRGTKDPYIQINIPRVHIMFNTSGTWQAYIRIGAAVIYEFTFTTFAAEVTTIDFDNLNIVDNGKNPIYLMVLDPNGTIVGNENLVNCCGSVELNWAGIDSSGKLYSHGFGIKPVVLSRCSYSEVFCSLRSELGEMVLYRTAICLFDQMLLSNRINPTTNSGIENKTKKKEEWVEKYKELVSKFARQLPALLRSSRSECVVCNRPQIGTLIK